MPRISTVFICHFHLYDRDAGQLGPEFLVIFAKVLFFQFHLYDRDAGQLGGELAEAGVQATTETPRGRSETLSTLHRVWQTPRSKWKYFESILGR